MKLIPTDGVILAVPDGLEEEIELAPDDAETQEEPGFRIVSWRILGPDGKIAGGNQ